MPLRRVPAALIGALLGPAPALACPTGLGAGLVLRADDGSVTTVTPTDRAGVQAERVVLAEGDGYVVLALHGLFEVEITDFDASGAPIPETRMISTFAVEPGLPGPGSILQGLMAEVVDAEGARFDRRHDALAGPLEPVVLGGCAYEGYAVELRIFEPSGPMVQHYVHVPALGVSVFLGFEDAHRPERTVVTAIEPLTGAAADR